MKTETVAVVGDEHDVETRVRALNATGVRARGLNVHYWRGEYEHGVGEYHIVAPDEDAFNALAERLTADERNADAVVVHCPRALSGLAEEPEPEPEPVKPNKGRRKAAADLSAHVAKDDPPPAETETETSE